MSTKLRGLRPSRRFFALGASALCAVLVSTAAFGEYVELPCLKTTGEQWINTLYIPKSTDRVEMKFRMTAIDATQALYCSRGTAANQSTFTAFSYTANKYIGFDFGGNSYGQGYYGSAISENQLVTVSAKNKEFKVNGSTSQSASGSFTGISPFSLFAAHLAGANLNAETEMTNYAKMIFRYFRVYDKDGNLVCDCVPVRDTEAETGSISEYGLYDRVAKRFLPNNGTAAFVPQKTVTVDTAEALVAATAVANPGDTIFVKDGTYRLEETATIGVDITVKSVNGKGSTFVEAPETVVKAFNVDGGRLEGFTFRNIESPNASLVRLTLGGFLVGCAFHDCKRSMKAGGRGLVCCDGGIISRCEFLRNDGVGSIYGAAISSSSSSVVVENCLFVDNKSGYGGALNMYSATWTIRNCTFIRNTSGTRGSYVYNNGQTPKFYNCLILGDANYPGNKALQQDGGIAASVSMAKRAQLFNCMIIGANDASWGGFNHDSSSGNIERPYPGFVSATAEDYHLLADSPMIAAGRAVTFSDTANLDLDGNPRPAIPSIGCYEFSADYVPSAPVLYVSPDGDDSDGSDWEKAYRSPLAALAAATAGTDILVGEGEYALAETLDVTKAVRIIGVKGRDKTTLKATGTAYRVVRLANKKAVLQGFTVKDGNLAGYKNVNDALVYSFRGGAGVGIHYNGGELLDCRITGCKDVGSETQGTCASSALSAAGGHIARCILDHNTGNAVSTLYATTKGHPQMDDCLFVDNTVASGKAVVRMRDPQDETWSSYYNKDADVQLRNCTILNNAGAACAVSRELAGGRVINVVMQNTDTTTRAWRDTASNTETATNATSKIWRNCASHVPVGTNCVSGVDLKLKSNGRPYFSSPCKEAGFIHLFATGPYAADVNGNPRVIEKDGEEVIDIGCYQLGAYGPGLMLLVR